MHGRLRQSLMLHLEIEKLFRARPAHREPHFIARLALEQLHRLHHTHGIRQYIVDAHELVARQHACRRRRAVFPHGDDRKLVLP